MLLFDADWKLFRLLTLSNSENYIVANISCF